MATSGFQVGNRKFQGLGTGSYILFCLLGRWRNVCVWLLDRNKNLFARKRFMSKRYENTFFTILLFCLMDRYRNVFVLFMEPEVTIASNCLLPNVGTDVCHSGNHRLPLQETASSQGLKLLVPNLGTIGYHCKELPIPTMPRNCWFPIWEP